MRLAELAKVAIRHVRKIEQEFANDPNDDSRPFHLATGATTLIHRLGRPLRLLRKQYPRTPIQVTVWATEEMVAGLLERRFDLAIISLPYDETNLTVLPLFDEELLDPQPLEQTCARRWSSLYFSRGTGIRQVSALPGAKQYAHHH